MKIIGRETELHQLQTFYNSPKAEFLAIYGRRRVGKTFLIQKFCESTETLTFHVTGLKDASMKEQIRNVSEIIGKTFYHGAAIQPQPNWLDVFAQLTRALETQPHQKIILFFDELPWMATKRSKFIQALDHYWNRYWSIDPRIKLIVCGSAASWMLEHLVHNKGGLYNRLTYQIALQPFTLGECRAFLEAKGIVLNHDQIVKLFMVTGGIPWYLDHIQPGCSADQNIDRLCFSKQGILFQEFDRLFAALFTQHTLCEELVRLIASQRYGIAQTDLMKRSSKHSGGRLKEKLRELEDSGFIESFIPYPRKERGIYYRILDEYIMFYLRWIEPVKHSIKRRDKEPGYWLSKRQSSAFESWAGYAFEAICFKHISAIRRALNIPPGAEIGTWRFQPPPNSTEKGAQIDLLFDRDDDAITLCEIKFNQQPFRIDKSYAQQLDERQKIFQKQTRTRKQLFLAWVTAHGLEPNTYSQSRACAVATLEDLFE